MKRHASETTGSNQEDCAIDYRADDVKKVTANWTTD
jgi:hypothetical protein